MILMVTVAFRLTKGDRPERVSFRNSLHFDPACDHGSMVLVSKLYWRHFSKPAANRGLAGYLIEHPIASVLEIGIGNGERLKQILTLATLRPEASQLRYAGIDLFESAEPTQKHMRLKDAHRMLAERNVKANLFPGDAASSLMRVVHTVKPSDLVIIDSDWGSSSANGMALEQWLPRVTHSESVVFARGQSSDPLTRIPVPAAAAFVKPPSVKIECFSFPWGMSRW